MKQFTFKVMLGSALLASSLFVQTAYATGPAAKRGVTGYVCTNSGGTLILRSGPGQQFKKITNIMHGAPVTAFKEVVGRDGMSWYNVSAGRHQGWVRYDYVCGL